MRILIAGDWHSELHEEGVSRAFRKLGHETIEFPWHRYFQPVSDSLWERLVMRPFKKAQNKYLAGPLIARLNRELLDAVRKHRPDMVFVYRGTHVLARTLRAIKRVHQAVVLIGYNNDDPFSPHYPRWLWRHFLAGLPAYDLMLAYRWHNVDDFRRAGAREVRLLRSWFIPERNHPVQLSALEQQQFGCDVVFIGHYEDDGRVAYLEEVVRQGWSLKLYGPGYDWDPVIRESPVLRGLVPVKLVWGEEYNKALCGAKIALCFLSKLNRDTYTRRCFEIPATATLMLAEYTDDLASLFRPDEEAVFFHSMDEMIEKLKQYLSDDSLRTRVGQAGRSCVESQGHDVVSRMEAVVSWANQLYNQAI
ncbi:MAG: CgeB family protein [Pseudomonadota bacterium]